MISDLRKTPTNSSLVVSKGSALSTRTLVDGRDIDERMMLLMQRPRGRLDMIENKRRDNR